MNNEPIRVCTTLLIQIHDNSNFIIVRRMVKPTSRLPKLN